MVASRYFLIWYDYLARKMGVRLILMDRYVEHYPFTEIFDSFLLVLATYSMTSVTIVPVFRRLSPPT